jgi:hypothetical protein
MAGLRRYNAFESRVMNGRSRLAVPEILERVMARVVVLTMRRARRSGETLLVELFKGIWSGINSTTKA